MVGDVTSFQGSLQVSIKRVRRAQEGEYDPGNYLPVSSKNPDSMYQELLSYVAQVKNPYLHRLLVSFFEKPLVFF